jgi:hypothetical protein
VRRDADGLDPPDLHGRLGVRGVRRGESALLSSAAQLLQARLGLSDDELCTALGADPLALIAGDVDERPELPILLTLTEEAQERVGAEALRTWLRRGPALDRLLRRDFAAFEDGLAELLERGLVIRRRGA